MKTYAFIDASNLFYGGSRSLGWKIDYRKLGKYLKDKYGASQIFYFGGVEIYDFEYDYLENDTVPLDQLEEYLIDLIKDKGLKLNEAEMLLIGRHLRRVRFYKKLSQFGYILYLKPVKLYEQEDGTTRRKANCDVDLALHLLKESTNFDKIILLSGDGDFLPVLKYLKTIGKRLIVLGRSERTAKEIKRFAGGDFRDFQYLRECLKVD